MNSSRCHLRLSPAIVTVRIVCYSTTSPESPSIIINRQTRKPPQVFPPSRPPSLRPLIDSANPRSRLPTSDVIDGAEDARARAHTAFVSALSVESSGATGCVLFQRVCNGGRETSKDCMHVLHKTYSGMQSTSVNF